MCNILSEIEFIEVMKNPEYLFKVVCLKKPIFIEVRRYEVNSTALRYYGIIELEVEEVVQVLSVLIAQQRMTNKYLIMEALETLDINMGLWYKINEEINPSLHTFQLREHRIMSKGTSGEPIDTSPESTVWEKHGSKIKTALALIAVAVVGGMAKSVYDKRREAAAQNSGGSGE